MRPKFSRPRPNILRPIPRLFFETKIFETETNGGFRGVFVLKSGLRILIWAPEVPFSVPPKTPKMVRDRNKV